MKKCEQCGKTFPMDAEVCDVCGSALIEVNETEAAPVAEPDAEPVVEQAAETTKEEPTIVEKALKFVKEKRALVIGIAAAVVVCLIAIICIVNVSNKSSGFASLNKDAIEIRFDDDKLIIYNGNAKKKEITTSINYSRTLDISGDRSTYLISDRKNNQSVYVVSMKGIQLVGEEINSCYVSNRGETVAYFKNIQNSLGELYLYNVKTKKTVKIDEDVLYDTVVLSADGKTVAYSTEKDGDYDNLKAFYSKNGKTPVAIAKNAVPVAVSNGATYVYYLKDNYYETTDSRECNLYLLKGKNSDKILTDAQNHIFYFNADLSEVIYSNDGKTYIRVKGKDAVKLSGNSINTVVDGMDDYRTIVTESGRITGYVFNLKTFKGATIKCGYTYYYLKSFSNVVKVLDSSSVSNVAFSADKKSLIYFKNHKLFKIANVAKPDNKKELGNLEDYSIYDFTASADLNTFYFRSDGDLYVKKGTSKPKRLASDVYITAFDYATGGVYYYVDYDSSESNNLYYSANGAKGKVVVKKVNSLSYTDGYYLIVTSENKKNDDKTDFYVIVGGSAKMIFTIE